MAKLMSFVVAFALVVGFVPSLALASSTIVYDGKGRVQSVVRDGPSGPIIYGRDGRLVSAVRNGRTQVGVVVQFDRRRAGTIGTSLRGGVGDN